MLEILFRFTNSAFGRKLCEHPWSCEGYTNKCCPIVCVQTVAEIYKHTTKSIVSKISRNVGKLKDTWEKSPTVKKKTMTKLLKNKHCNTISLEDEMGFQELLRRKDVMYISIHKTITLGLFGIRKCKKHIMEFWNETIMQPNAIFLFIWKRLVKNHFCKISVAGFTDAQILK